jgi:hypothetical protein
MDDMNGRAKWQSESGSSNDKPSARQNGITFSLRGLLGFMFWTALACVLIAPFARNLSREQWTEIGKTLGVAVLALTCSVASTVILQLRVERRAGAFLYSYRDPQAKVVGVARVGISALGLISLVVLSVYIVEQKLPLAPFQFAFVIILLAMPLTYLIADTVLPERFRCTYRLYSNGVVWAGMRFVPWNKVRILTWNADKGWLTWSLNGQFAMLDVRDSERTNVDEILRHYADVNS